MDNMETLKLPSISSMRDLTIINIPSVYSNDDNFSIKYASKLTDLIEYTSGNIVLNLSNNYGGLKEPMIIGASSLILMECSLAILIIKRKSILFT